MYLIIENDSNLKDAYSIRLAETVDLSKCLGKDDFDVNSKEFIEKLDKFIEPTTGEAYISKYVGNDFINSDKVTCVDKVTYDKLVKKISEYITNNPQLKLSLDKEKQKLPQKYDLHESQKENLDNSNKSSLNQRNKQKADNNLQTRQADAKQRIAFYQNKKNAQSAKSNVFKRVFTGKGRG